VLKGGSDVEISGAFFVDVQNVSDEGEDRDCGEWSTRNGCE
jgi:hypothetical protein